MEQSYLDQAGEPASPQWFDARYQVAGRDAGAIPWARLTPHPSIGAWVENHSHGEGRQALVIAAGLGDDAEALAAAGYQVEAFDVSATAVGWTEERFPDSTVNYRVADVFELPESWRRAFDVVVEVYTVQSIVLEQREEVIGAISATVAPGGTLLVVALARPDERRPSGPPFPVSRRELEHFGRCGLEEVDFAQDGMQFFVEYRRPE